MNVNCFNPFATAYNYRAGLLVFADICCMNKKASKLMIMVHLQLLIHQLA